MLKPERISEIDAARRQIETAIYLYFLPGDPVSIHTLVHAATTVLRDICKARKKGGSILRDKFVRSFPKDERDQVYTKINKAANFFKHVRKDPKAVLVFSEETTNFMLMDAILLFRKVRRKPHLQMQAFRCYFSILYPHTLNIPRAELPQMEKWTRPLLTVSKGKVYAAILGDLQAMQGARRAEKSGKPIEN